MPITNSTPDAELVIHVQHENPSDPDAAKNWRPSPDGSFTVTARVDGAGWSLVDGSDDTPQVVPVEE